MVCEQCNILIKTGEKKLRAVVTPDNWKEGAKNTSGTRFVELEPTNLR